MNLYDLVKDNPNLNLTINGGQLIEAIDHAVNKRMEKVQREAEEKLLTTEEACQLARVSRPTLHRWKSKGLIPFIKIGKNIRYKESDLKKLLESRTM